MIAEAIGGAILRLNAAAGREDGQTLVEYALIGLLVAVALVGALFLVGGKVDDVLNAVRGAFGG
ncbi:MAG TPA: hypothetical protein VF094_04680 [Gaiellaceae bacterium]